MQNKLLLSELNLLIRDSLIEAFPDTVWVVAEISELKENRSGHCYLELIEKNEEDDEITARVRATVWSYTFRMLKPYFETTTRQLFTSGIKVLIQATVEFHPAYGLSLNIKDIDPTYTVGDLVKRRVEIINRLKGEGVFDMNKELPLPEVPQKIAIISSATAAGYQDFINQLENNSYGFVFHIRLFEAFMQGAEAAQSIIKALEQIYNYEDFFDVVIIIRGGGAQADLSCFDNYELAVNITQFPLPVLTGIGHEKDDTIIDMVAHTRLKTPTAVAEFLISGANRFYEKLINLETNILNRTKEILEEEHIWLNNISKVISNAGQFFLVEEKANLYSLGRDFKERVSQFSFLKFNQLNDVENHILGNSERFLYKKQNSLIQIGHDIKNSTELVLFKKKNRIKRLSENIRNEACGFIKREVNNIHLKEKSAELLNPVNVLNRGYTITYSDGKIIKSAKKLKTNDELETRFADGKVKSKIIK
ncbi:MAG: exodeoxyribonuclease VII large subunit [Mariniphaga sp.]|nr:exodeoxyribonuclease VII large subunit [Mariniphaga sp.]